MRAVLRIGWAGALCGGLLVGCGGGPQGTGQGPEPSAGGPGPAAERGADTGAGDDALARAAVPEAELAPPGEGSDAATEEPERFNISAQDLPVREVMLSLVADTPYSVIIEPEVAGTVTLDLQEVTVPEAFRFLSRSYGYGVTRAGQRFFVEPAARRTRMFQVDYLDVARQGSSSTEVSSGQITQSNISGQGGGGGGGQGGGAKGSTLTTQSEADFWKQVRQGLSAIVGVPPQGTGGGQGQGNGDGQGGESAGGGEGPQLVVHSQAGVVLVRARPDRLKAVADYLEAVEGGSHRQVIIEAKVLEVRLEEGHQAGVNWTALGRSGQSRGMVSQIDPDLRADNIPNSVLGSNSASQAFGELTTGATGGGFAAAVGTENFAGLLRLLETQGKVNVLSSPRVATVNNQKAVIKVGVDEFFLTDISMQSNTTTAGQTQNYDVELTPFFSGIALDVTPQISKDGMVTLHVHPSVSDVTSSDKEIQLSDTESLRFPLARSDVRESDSIVRAQDGEVVVIGGLMKERTEVNRSGIPLLQRIPVLGALFRQRTENQVKRELVILLRPNVVVGQDAGSERARELKRKWEQGLQTGEPG